VSSHALALAAGAITGVLAGLWASRVLRAARPDWRAAMLLCPLLGLTIGIALATRITPAPLLAACLLLLAAALPLSAIDTATRKLPDRLLLPAIPACAALLSFAAARAADYGPLWRSLTAGTVVFLAFTALALAAPGQLGFGDCKAAALCALPLGYLGWRHVLLGITAAYVFAALVIIGRHVAHRTTEAATRTLAFGPFIFAGAFAALFAS
jgi:leader peptidase (prepilin peptidase)/N-methyltransferase